MFYIYQKGVEFIMTNVVYSTEPKGTPGVLINVDEFGMRELLNLEFSDSFC